MVRYLYHNRLAVDIAGLKMKTPVTTASGTFGFGLEFTDFLDLEKVGAITVKGTTLAPRAGNKGQRVVETPSGILNCIGLENPGSDYFLKETLPKLKKYNVPVIVNIDASSPEEYGELAAKLDVKGVDAVEINVSCPNIKDGGLVFGTNAKSMAQEKEYIQGGHHQAFPQRDQYYGNGKSGGRRRDGRTFPDQYAAWHENRHPPSASCAGQCDRRSQRPLHPSCGGAHVL